jgi:hypothetical protein
MLSNFFNSTNICQILSNVAKILLQNHTRNQEFHSIVLDKNRTNFAMLIKNKTDFAKGMNVFLYVI